jgi:hypothetical protein
MGFAAHRPVETHLEILDEVVEHPQPLGILAIIHICQRPDLGGLPKLMQLLLKLEHDAPKGLTSNEMCSLSILTSSSWRPTMFFFGHATSSSLERA